MRSARSAPSAGIWSEIRVSRTKSHRNGNSAATQPLGVGWMPSGSKEISLASLAWAIVIMLTSGWVIRFSTTLRRSMARSGKRAGLVWLGFCTSPASMAAWSSVRSLAVVPQKCRAAASTP